MVENGQITNDASLEKNNDDILLKVVHEQYAADSFAKAIAVKTQTLSRFFKNLISSQWNYSTGIVIELRTCSAKTYKLWSS